MIFLSINENKSTAVEVAKNEIIHMTQMVSQTTGFGFGNFDFEYVRNAVSWLKKDERLWVLTILDNDNKVIAGLNHDKLTETEAENFLGKREPVLIDDKLYYSLPIYSNDPINQKQIKNNQTKHTQIK